MAMVGAAVRLTETAAGLVGVSAEQAANITAVATAIVR